MEAVKLVNQVVNAFTEDVVFGFAGKSAAFGEVEGMIYMDEPDQSGVTVNNVEYDLDCGNQEE